MVHKNKCKVGVFSWLSIYLFIFLVMSAILINLNSHSLIKTYISMDFKTAINKMDRVIYQVNKKYKPAPCDFIFEPKEFFDPKHCDINNNRLIEMYDQKFLKGLKGEVFLEALEFRNEIFSERIKNCEKFIKTVQKYNNTCYYDEKGDKIQLFQKNDAINLNL